MLTRTYGFISRHWWMAVALLLIVTGIAIYSPALGNSRFVFGTDTYSHDYIFHLYGWNTIRETGRLPLWCPYAFCGLPVIASYALCPFYPTQLLYYILPHNTAFTMQYAMALAVGGICFVIWMRINGLRRSIAVWAGLLFMVSGHFLTLTHAGHLQKMIAIAWAPLALAGAHLITGRLYFARGIVLVALALCMQCLAGHLQIFYATAAVSILHVLVHALFSPEIRDAFRLIAAGRHGSLSVVALPALTIAACVGGIVLGSAASAVQTFPGLEMGSVSNRADGVAFQEAVETSYPPGELLEYVIPRFLGDSVRGANPGYFGSWGSERIVSDFIGAGIIVLAGIALWKSRRRVRWFWLVILLSGILVGLGDHTPVYAILYAAMPGFKQFRSPGTFMFFADIAIIALAALGLETLVQHDRKLESESSEEQLPRKGLLGWLKAPENRLITLLAALAIVGLVLLIVGYGRNLSIKIDIATDAERRRYHLFRGWALLGGELLVAAVLITATIRRIRFAAVLTSVLLLGICLFHNAYFLRFDPLPPYANYLHSQPIYAALRNVQDKPLRMLEERELKTDNILHGVGTQAGYHPIIFGRYEKAQQSLGSASEKFTQMFSINLAHSYSSTAPPGQWGLVRQFANPPQALWQKMTPSPYVKNNITGVAVRSEKDAARALNNPAFDPERTAIFEEGALAYAGIVNQVVPATAELTEWQPTRLQFNINSAGLSVLPIAEVYAPGWKASNGEGNELKLIPANLAQRAIVWEGGPGTIRMIYDPFSFRCGLFLSLLVVAGVGAVAAARWQLGREAVHSQ